MAKLLVQVLSGPIRAGRWELRKDGTLFWWFGFWAFKTFNLLPALAGFRLVSSLPEIPDFPPYRVIDTFTGRAMARHRLLQERLDTPVLFDFLLKDGSVIATRITARNLIAMMQLINKAGRKDLVPD